MNVKKIIKGILSLGVVSSIAYAAYKLGESNGEVNAKFREKYGVDYDKDEFSFDEPDDECILRVRTMKNKSTLPMVGNVLR